MNLKGKFTHIFFDADDTLWENEQFFRDAEAEFAALLADEIDGITLADVPESFDSMIRTRVTYVPQAVMPWGVLKFTDMPELIEAVGAKVLE